MFIFNDTAPTEIYTLSLHDALPISRRAAQAHRDGAKDSREHTRPRHSGVHDHPERDHELPNVGVDRKSTRLNSSHANISYAVFCLKKKKNKQTRIVDEEII